MYKNHIWFGPAHENMGPKKLFFSPKKKVMRFSFSLAAREKATALKTTSCLYAPTFYFNLKSQMKNEFALAGRWQHCAPGSGGGETPKNLTGEM